MNLLQDKNVLFEPRTSDSNKSGKSLNNQNSSQSNRKSLSNNDLFVEDYNDDNNNDTTLYETPFHSFINHSAEDLDATPVARKYVPQPMVAKVSLLTQGILDASSDLTVEVNNNRKEDTLSRARTLEKL
jgi:hypothetical protein